MLAHFDSLFDLLAAFPDEQSCLDHVRAMRWKDGESCPHCGGLRIYHFSDKQNFKCGDCRARFSIKVGTIFHDTKLPLRKWFMAMWMITNHPKGIASTTLAKDLKITQKTAWFVLHRIRHAARTRSFNMPLKGKVEIDETYVGGKATNRHKGKRGKGKSAYGHTPVIGAVERSGDAVAVVSPLGVGRPEAQKFIDAAVSPDAELLVTDAHPAYWFIEGYPQHKMINHHEGQYVRGEVHTQTIESVWALLKRQIIGIHHWVSEKHLQRYVSEMTWRFSRRDMAVTPRMNELFNGIEGPLPYKTLIA
jgi:transposase-like protein